MSTVPLPFSPSTTSATFFARLKNLFQPSGRLQSRSRVQSPSQSRLSLASPSGSTADSQLSKDGASSRRKVMVAFWLFGLINNILYVIILSSALDLVGASVPKGVVLLADVFPSFALKLVAPYFMHMIPYRRRIVILASLSVVGMLLVGLGPDAGSGTVASSTAIAIKLFGISLASLSSGGGELSFLGLTHFYGPESLSMWSSGTGGAGVFGAGGYVLATVVLGLSPRSTLVASATLPLVMLATFFWFLPLDRIDMARMQYTPLIQSPKDVRSGGSDEQGDDVEASSNSQASSSSRLLQSSLRPPSPSSAPSAFDGCQGERSFSFAENLARARSLFFPYMLPLLLVYVAEYTINQGVAPTLLFPIEDTPFSRYREFYPTYNAIYQLGVFISRSSRPFIQIHTLYLPSFLQVGNLVFLIAHAMFDFLPSVWILFLIIFWEGLLGGLVYISTFAEISENVPEADREFSLSATSVSDSGGILLSSLISMVIEVSLCDYQLARGRPYCQME